MLENKTQEFLDIVESQIEYQSVRGCVRQELEEHMEDRIDDYLQEGMSEEDAIARTVEGMGNPIEIGREINNVKNVRPSINIWLMTSALLLSGLMFGAHIFQSLIFGKYVIAGAATLIFIVFKGYKFAVRMPLATAAAGLICLAAGMAYAKISWTYPYGAYISPYGAKSDVILYNGKFLLIPLVFLLIYGMKKRILAVIVGCIFSALMFLPDLRMSSSILILDFVLTGCIITFILKSFETKDRMFKIGAVMCAAVLMVSVILCATIYSDEFADDTEAFFHPENTIESVYSDGYNAVVIKSLLAKARPLGSVSLSEQELYDYANCRWYFGSDYDGIARTDYSCENTGVEEILPFNYENNYLIAYLIIKWGIIPGIELLLVICTFFITLAVMTCKIRNSLGAMLSFAGMFTLIAQFILYTLGNFGWQFGRFCNLPFISEGLVSIFINALLLGIIIAAYRYDNVQEAVYI